MGKQPGGGKTQRANHAAGQRCQVNEHIRLVVFNGVGQRVGQYQAAFGIGVNHFNRFARIRANHVAGFGGIAIHAVLGCRNYADQMHGQLQFGRQFHDAQHRRRTAHVAFHLVHIRGVLERNAARIKRHALAHQTSFLVCHSDKGGILRLVFHYNHHRRVFATFVHGQQCVHSHPHQLFLFNYLHIEAVCRARFLGPVCECLRGFVVARRVYQIHDPHLGFGGGAANLHGFLGQRNRFLIHVKIQHRIFIEEIPVFFRFGLVEVQVVASQH